MSHSKESLGIKGVTAIHVFVRDLERSRDHYVEKLDFFEIASSTPDFEMEHRARASVVEAGSARLVLMEPLGAKGESFRWLEKHPEGIGRIVFEVEDAERTFSILTARGATTIDGVFHRNVEGGRVVWFDIATAIGDTQFRFIQYEGRTPIMPDLQRHIPAKAGSNRYGIMAIDHITSNFLTLEPALLWMEHVLGLERYWNIEFHTQDVKKGHLNGSGLKSVVMWDPESEIKFANNEPRAPGFKSSQIYIFCEDHKGPGVQHLALTVPNIIETVRGLRKSGVGFMPIPPVYYDLLPERLKQLGVHQIPENLDELRELEILVDGKAEDEYLLQIFMQEAANQFHDTQAGPLFLEVIQRMGDKGFGAGNFRALFESIELQHEVDGRMQS